MKRLACFFVIACLAVLSGSAAVAGGSTVTTLHFSQPLLTQSPMPETRARVDVATQDEEEDEGTVKESALRVGAEYAFHRTFSIVVDVPFVRQDVGEGHACRKCKCEASH